MNDNQCSRIEVLKEMTAKLTGLEIPNTPDDSNLEKLLKATEDLHGEPVFFPGKNYSTDFFLNILKNLTTKLPPRSA